MNLITFFIILAVILTFIIMTTGFIINQLVDKFNLDIYDITMATGIVTIISTFFLFGGYPIFLNLLMLVWLITLPYSIYLYKTKNKKL